MEPTESAGRGDEGEEATAPGARPSALTFLPDLYFRPGRFFSSQVWWDGGLLTTIVFVVFGSANAVDNIDGRLVVDSDHPFGVSWVAYWIAGVLSGVIGAAILFGVGGWWYRVRLKFSGVPEADPGVARRVYGCASLVWALPFLAASIWATWSYPTPRASIDSDSLVTLPLLVFPFWSAVTSYRGVRAVFPVVPFKALLWFGVLPALLYGAGLLGITVWSIYQAAAPPDVDHPTTYSTATFAFDHPANWLLEVDETDDGYVSIEPAADDGILIFHVGRDFESAVEARDAYQLEMSEVFAVPTWAPLDHWGDLVGKGWVGQGRLDDVEARLVVFAAERDGLVMAVREITALDVLDRVEPGYALIRESFDWR